MKSDNNTNRLFTIYLYSKCNIGAREANKNLDIQHFGETSVTMGEMTLLPIK